MKPVCTADEVLCGDLAKNDTIGKGCIPRAWICDGDDDCVAGVDEQNCNQTICRVKYLLFDLILKCILNLCILLSRYMQDNFT